MLSALRRQRSSSFLRSLTGPRHVRWKAVSTSASCRAQTTELAFPAQRVGKSTPIAAPASGPARRNSGALSRLAVARENGGSGGRCARTSRDLPRRTLQHALQNEGVSYRDIVLELRMRRAGQLLSTTGRPLPKWRSERQVSAQQRRRLPRVLWIG